MLEGVRARFLSNIIGSLILTPHIRPKSNPQANLNPSDEEKSHEHRQLRAFAGNINRNARAVRSQTARDGARRALAAEEEEN